MYEYVMYIFIANITMNSMNNNTNRPPPALAKNGSIDSLLIPTITLLAPPINIENDTANRIAIRIKFITKTKSVSKIVASKYLRYTLPGCQKLEKLNPLPLAISSNNL